MANGDGLPVYPMVVEDSEHARERYRLWFELVKKWMPCWVHVHSKSSTDAFWWDGFYDLDGIFPWQKIVMQARTWGLDLVALTEHAGAVGLSDRTIAPDSVLWMLLNQAAQTEDYIGKIKTILGQFSHYLA